MVAGRGSCGKDAGRSDRPQAAALASNSLVLKIVAINRPARRGVDQRDAFHTTVQNAWNAWNAWNAGLAELLLAVSLVNASSFTVDASLPAAVVEPVDDATGPAFHLD
jgi:hypothetical protein